MNSTSVCLVSCGSIDRIGFVLLNPGPTFALPKNYLALAVGSTRYAASSLSELTLLLVPLSQPNAGTPTVLVDELDAGGL